MWDFSSFIEQDKSNSYQQQKNEYKFNMWLLLINVKVTVRTTEAKTKYKIYHVLRDANELVLNCKRF